MKKILLLLPVLLLCAWGFKGHRSIALIAQKHLNPSTAPVVLSYLGNESISDASTWADEHKNPKTAPLHFINLPLGLTHEQFVKSVKESSDNIYTAILEVEQTLKSSTATAEQKNEALKYLIHFVGDAHQPMHVSRKEDKGGNDIQVRFDNKGTNLHALWDSKLIDYEGLSESDIVKNYDVATSAEIKKWQSDDITEWLWESYQISSELYSNVKPGQKIDKAYYEKYIPVIHKRVNMAGIRLAGELNRIFAEQKTVVLEKKILENVQKIKLEEIQNYVDKNVTVSGEVYGTKDVGNMILVNVGAAFPNQILTVVLKGAAKSLENQVKGKEITVTGQVILYKGKPEIIVQNTSDIQIKN